MASSGGKRGKKRKLEDMLGDLPSVGSFETYFRRVKATDRWRDLHGKAAWYGATVFEHEYRRLDTATGNVMIGKVRTAHTHGEFTNSVREESGKFTWRNLNISTKRVGGAARSHDKLFDITGDDKTGVTNIMRVIKGTHTSKGLVGTKDAARGAVEFGTEIGISEFSRGGGTAVFHAMESLYLLKHGVINRTQFLDPGYGFRGAGEGGAERLRALQADRKAALGWHKKDLKTYFETHVRTKQKWQTASFKDWRRHKIAKWMQKV